MDSARIHHLLPHLDGDLLAARFAEFRVGFPDGEVEDFVASLHRDGLITADQLRDALSSLDVSLAPGGLGYGGWARFQSLRLLGRLDQGSMGEIFIARDPELRRNVAVKRIHVHRARDVESVRRFAREVLITAQLDHPAIVPVYGLDHQADGTPAYSMKLIRGRDLKSMLVEAREAVSQRRPVPAGFDLPARLEIFLQVCDALSHAHSRGVIHRDLKPANIMVGAYHEVLVMDWGIARLIGSVDEVGAPSGISVDPTDEEEGTLDGHICGTPAYMSPEQAQAKNSQLDGQSDQFALGLILFELVTLRKPRTANSDVELLYKAMAGKVEPLVPLDRRARVPRELAGIIRRATRVEPARRYASVALLAEDVRRFLRDEEVLAAPDNLVRRLGRWVARHRTTAVSMGFGLILMLVLVTLLGVASAFVVREVSRQQSRAREERLSEVLGLTTAQASQMETQLLRYEGLMQALAAVAEVRLTEHPAPQPYYLAPSFFRAGEGPPDLVPARFYDTTISLRHPDVVLAPSASEEALVPRIHQLVSLAPVFRRVVTDSLGDEARSLDEADLESRIRGVGVPLVWAYVATEDGILAGYPGTGEYPEGYDPREEDWYQATRDLVGPHWEPASPDESGLGLLVTCERALRDASGALLGVAAVDITVGWLIDTLLVPADLEGRVVAWVVDEQGRVVVRSDLSAEDRQVADSPDFEPEPFPYPRVLALLRADPAGGHVELEGRLFAWSGLEMLGWSYVVTGDAAQLLAN